MGRPVGAAVRPLVRKVLQPSQKEGQTLGGGVSLSGKMVAGEVSAGRVRSRVTGRSVGVAGCPPGRRAAAAHPTGTTQGAGGASESMEHARSPEPQAGGACSPCPPAASMTEVDGCSASTPLEAARVADGPRPQARKNPARRRAACRVVARIVSLIRQILLQAAGPRQRGRRGSLPRRGCRHRDARAAPYGSWPGHSSASGPRSSVRIFTTSSTGWTETMPSPRFPVRAAPEITSTSSR